MKNKLVRVANLTINGVLGGLMISIGLAVLLNCSSKIAGAILFAVGLLTINKFGLGLYTGKVGYIRSWSTALDTLIVLIANFVGCLIMLLYPLNGADQSLADKMTASHLELFVKGVVCGILIFVCVANKDKPIYTIFAVPSFILCGAEHSIADIALCLAAKEFSLKALVFVLIIALGNAVGSLAFSLLLELRDNLDKKVNDVTTSTLNH